MVEEFETYSDNQLMGYGYILGQDLMGGSDCYCKSVKDKAEYMSKVVKHRLCNDAQINYKEFARKDNPRSDNPQDFMKWSMWQLGYVIWKQGCIIDDLLKETGKFDELCKALEAQEEAQSTIDY